MGGAAADSRQRDAGCDGRPLTPSRRAAKPSQEREALSPIGRKTAGSPVFMRLPNGIPGAAGYPLAFPLG